ncbi:MAG: hypothetical protein SFT92_08480 [Rickettsiales bacterium]|nr:hypothetical protein [Rickettsiales bacterium]
MAPNPKDYSVEDLESKYGEITVLFDYSEQLTGTVESELVTNPEQQLAIIEPLINEIGDATDILSEEFVFIAEGIKRKSKNRANKARIEAALRKLYAAIHEYEGRVKDVTKKAHGAFMNIADAIVQKIQRQVEEIVVIFLEFVHISLQSLMGKAELEALKVRDSRVALMMHQHALAQQQ